MEGMALEALSILSKNYVLIVPYWKAFRLKAESEFERLVERGDDGSVMDQVERVEAARAELNKSHTMMMLRMRRVLTTDQWAKFTAMHQAAERERNQANGRK